MSDLFLGIVSLSLSASWLVAAVMAFRFLLKKAPKSMHVALWGLVALRLILPVSFESVFSLVPEAIGNGTVVEQWVQTPVQSQAPDTHEEQPDIDYGITSIPPAPAQPQFTLPPEYTNPEGTASAPTLGDTLVPFLTSVWILGMCAMAVYALGNYMTLRWQVRTAVRLDGCIYQSEFAPTAFVLGLLLPRIYVPYGMSDSNLAHVVAHERSHIARLDHWWKPLGFALLTLHWFNPLMWLAFFLLCRDIELACDERVIRALERDQRADYSQTLLTCSIHEKMILACPVAFGQAGVKERVRNVLNYRKPGLWITAVTVLAMIVSMVCFYAVPPAQADEPDPTVTPPVSVDPGEPNVGSSQRLTTGDGIEYTVSVGSITPVGLALSVDVDVKCEFLIYNYYWIERQTESGWETLPSMMEDPCHLVSVFAASGNPIFPGPTDTRNFDWSGKYGVLSPGTYRLCTVVFEGEDPVKVEFTIGDPGDSPEAQALLRYYDALNDLLTRKNYCVVNTYSVIEDPAVDVDADAYDHNFIDTYEYMRAGNDYLKQEYTYTAGMFNQGFMIRDGVEYRTENETHGNITTPVIGWALSPGSKTDFFTRWVSCWTMKDLRSVTVSGNTTILELKGSGYVRSNTVTITYDENGRLEQVVHVEEYASSNYQEAHTATYSLAVKDVAIAVLIESQDVETCRDFTWTGTLPEDETVLERAFVNTEAAPMDTVSQVIARARAESDVPYSNVMVYHDAQAQVWKVEFWVSYGKAYTESVYLNADGTTIMVTYRGPLDI